MLLKVVASLALIGLVVSGCGSSASTTTAPVETEFTIMTFNIEYGGDEVDFAKVIEAIEKADPDVVALEEAEGNTVEVAKALGWPYYSVRSQLVSRVPLIDPPGADGVYEYAEIAPGAVVAIANVHLPSDPYGPYDVRDGKSVEEVLQLERDTRLAAIEPKLASLAELSPDIPIFLLGDFNAPSHLDWTEATVGVRSHILYPVEWPVSVAVEAAGFRDPYRELHPDPVADPGLTWWAGRPLIDGYPDPSEPQDRIDIIYAAGPSTTTGIRIVGEAGGPQVDIEVEPWGTDHRGVVADFTLTPGVPAPFVATEGRLLAVGDDHTIRYRAEQASDLRIVDSTGTVTAEQEVTTLAGSWGLPDLGPGQYSVELLDGDTLVAENLFTVVEQGTAPTIASEQVSYASGEPVTITWQNGPGSRWDWIGLFPAGSDTADGDYRFYVYTGQEISGSVAFDENGFGEWPIPPGEYEVHYLLDDGYESLAEAPITITP